MSELISALLATSCADRELLIRNEGLGDIATTAREVEFLLIAPDARKANLIARFINDNRYGDAVARSVGESHQIVVSIVMPTTQTLLCSVSGLMECIADIFELQYDGWESNICRGTSG